MLLSFDVVSLYTNIPHDELRAVLQDIFDSKENPFPPSHFLLNLVVVLMETDYFRYDQQYYLQTKGVAMGSIFALSAANLFMDSFEQCFILNPDVNPFYQHIIKFFRYIDDIFCIYSDSETIEPFFKLAEYIALFN